MRTKIAVLAVAVIAVSATLGASAYTTGTVTREANINVVNDDAGLIGLTDGNSGDLVGYDNNGELSIDFTKGGAGGVNTNAMYELGDSANPATTYAFTITNNDVESHSLTVEYLDAGAVDGTKDNIRYEIYDASGTNPNEADGVTDPTTLSVSEESNSATIDNVASGETLYVVMVVDTAGLGSSADLSGTLTVSA